MYSPVHIPRADFDRLHATHIASAQWKTFRSKYLEWCRYRCCVCGFDYLKRGVTKWQLVVDHKTYRKNGKMIFGRETYSDVRCLCPTCNKKGVRTDDQIRMARVSYRWGKALTWLVFAPFRLIRWAWRKARPRRPRG